MYISKLCVLLCALSCARARSAPEDFSSQSARLLTSIRLSPARAALIPGVIGDVVQALQTRFPGCKGELYGSIAAGLGIFQSDLDIAIIFQHDDPFLNMTEAELVLETADIIQQHPRTFEVVNVIPVTRVPIVSVTHLPSQFSVDISFSNYNGVRNSKLIYHLMTLDQRAKDLAQILKYWARLHGLTGHTMLPSYGVVTMAIFYLQQQQILPPITYFQAHADKYMVGDWNMGFKEENYTSDNQETLCALLGGFFRYYADFKFEDYIASPFVGYPIEIDRFRVWETVPEEFDLYRANVRQNISEPLKLKTPIVQDMFQHNSNLAHRIIEPSHRLLVEEAIGYAAEMYREGCLSYFDKILRYN